MKPIPFIVAALIAAFAATSFVWAKEDIRASMEAANKEWAIAYNGQNGAAFAGMYAGDAILMVPGKPPIQGAEAIGQFWGDLIKSGSRKNVVLEILSVQRDGRLAYQTSRWSLDLTADNGEITKISGSAVRVFEKGSDGKWLIKAHIFNAD